MMRVPDPHEHHIDQHEEQHRAPTEEDQLRRTIRELQEANATKDDRIEALEVQCARALRLLFQTRPGLEYEEYEVRQAMRELRRGFPQYDTPVEAIDATIGDALLNGALRDAAEVGKNG